MQALFDPAAYAVKPLDQAAMAQCRAHWDQVAKPLNSLGQLEDVVARMAGLLGTAQVQAQGKCVLVLCADNGVVAEGVTQTDASVTAAVALSIARGTGNINQMARVAGAQVIPVDVGMLTEVDHPAVLNRKLRRGTGNIAQGPAMSRQEAQAMVQVGIDLARQRVQAGDKLIATGEMGIGNTTTSSALAALLLDQPVEKMTGRGAGLSGAGLQRKIAAIRRAIQVNQPDPGDPLDALAKLGGFDIAAMAGVFLGGAAMGVPVVVDGFISSAAALVAQRLCPACRQAMLASHVSREPAGAMMLQALGLTPIIHAGMALGEGTGAVALMPLIDMALAVYHQGSSFEGIQVAAYQPQQP